MGRRGWWLWRWLGAGFLILGAFWMGRISVLVGSCRVKCRGVKVDDYPDYLRVSWELDGF